jgi:hypothetical protein
LRHIYNDVLEKNLSLVIGAIFPFEKYEIRPEGMLNSVGLFNNEIFHRLFSMENLRKGISRCHIDRKLWRIGGLTLQRTANTATQA